MISFVIFLVLMFYLIGTSYAHLKQNDQLDIKDNYKYNAINYAFFVSISLMFILAYKELLIYADDVISVLIAIFGATFIIILVGFIPLKALANSNSEGIIRIFKPLIMIVSIVFSPISLIFIAAKKLFKNSKKEVITEEEILDFIDKAEKEDSISENESQLIKSVLDFAELKVLDVYTPRTEMIAIKSTNNNDEIVELFKKSGFSRLPIYEKSLDNIIGIINHKDFYNKVLIDKNELKSIIQKPVEVTEYMELSSLLSLLKINKSHMAIVKDEFGGTIGIVTMEDLLEEIVGDIWDEHDTVLETIRKIDDNTFIVLGTTYLEDLNEVVDVEELLEEDFSTVNGWAIHNLGKIGKKGDSFTFNNYTIVVNKADNKRILEVKIIIKITENIE